MGTHMKDFKFLVAHDCGYSLSCYMCRATRVAADFLDFIAFCRCSTGGALHPLKILVSHLAPPPPVPGGVAPKFGSEKVSRYTGVSQLQLRVSRYTVQLSLNCPSILGAFFQELGWSPRASQMPFFLGEGKNLHKNQRESVLGLGCPLGFVPLSAPTPRGVTRFYSIFPPGFQEIG